MKRLDFLRLIYGAALTSCIGGCDGATKNGKLYAGFVTADNLITDIDKYANRKVRTEGYIAHVCPVNGRKMKLMSDNGEVIVIISQGSESFDHSLNKKRISVYGLVKEKRIENPYIDEKEAEKTILCHVDRTPCKDTKWINKMIEAGEADYLVKKEIDELRGKMKKQGKGYVSVVTIVCDRYETVAE